MLSTLKKNMDLIHLRQTKLSDLKLLNAESRIAQYTKQLKSELRNCGLHFEFRVWISDEWFSPDGVAGFAMPFYLFHPELMRLQKTEMGIVEGRTDREILKLMRHELGHVIDNIYNLRQAPGRKELFGDWKKTYPKKYIANKHSRDFVRYLPDCYAQAHPDEDFAETFAYWLDPSKSWRTKKLTPLVLQKLEWVDQIVQSRCQRPTPNYKLRLVDPLQCYRYTLGTHYRKLGYKKHQSTVANQFFL